MFALRASASNAADSPRPDAAKKHLHVRHVSRHHRKPVPAAPTTRKPAYLPPHKLSLTPEERAAPPPTVLDRGRAEVAGLCDALAGEGDTGGAAACREALSFYDDEVAADAADDARRDLFHSFVRTLLYSEGGLTGFVDALLLRKRLDERAAAGGGGDRASATAPADPPSAAAAARRAALTALFHKFDRNGDGRLDADEFRSAAAAAGDPLTGREAAQALAAFDGADIARGGHYLTLEEFVAAVEAEDLRAQTPLAAWLRAHGGGGWGELPGSLDAMSG